MDEAPRDEATRDELPEDLDITAYVGPYVFPNINRRRIPAVMYAVLAVDQTEALAVASRTVGFPVGHASAQLAWRGLRSRPTWRILLYSADEPPSIRGLVELDAVDGAVLGEYTETNPEDWSKYGLEPGSAAAAPT